MADSNIIPFRPKDNLSAQEAAQARLKAAQPILDAQGWQAWLERTFGPGRKL